jgi:hypothetical protein
VRARVWAALAAAAAPVVSLGCDVGQSPVTGLSEPIVVSGGQFISGDLPGTPPLAEDAQAPVSVDGGADTAAIGVRLADLGTGYWIVPAGSPDTQTPGALTFGMSTGFNIGDAPGNYALRFVAIGGSGNAGRQFELQPPLCIDSRIPDNGHACTPEIAPPAAVFTLEWDTNFDLDMHVVVPGGEAFDTKMRVGEPIEAGLKSIPAGQPFIDRDSMRNCVPDGLRQEDLIFPEPLTKGSYFIFVDPYAACGQNAVHFTYTIYQSTGKCPACNLEAKAKYSGELLASQVTGGTSPPTFVAELPVE